MDRGNKSRDDRLEYAVSEAPYPNAALLFFTRSAST